MMKRLSLLAVLGASLSWLVLAERAWAQDASASPHGDALGCELHVWTGSKLNSVYDGWLHGGVVNGAVDGRDGYPSVPHDPSSASETSAQAVTS